MPTSTVHTESKYDSAVFSLQSMPSPETQRRRLTDKSDMEVLLKHFLDTSPWTWHTTPLTSGSGYRWKGEDTLNWGDPEEWIQIKWVQCLVRSSQQDICLKEYDTFQSIIQSTHLHRLEEMFSFRGTAAVQGFLQTHPYLIDVLLEAYPYLQKHFGPNLQVTLRVVRDPEMEGWEQLFAYIHSDLSADEALTRLNKLDDEWFLKQLDRVGDLLNFDL